MCETYSKFQFQVTNKVSTTFEPLNPSLGLKLNIKNTTGSSRNPPKYIIIPRPSETPPLFRSRVHISDEIEASLEQDEYFEYALSNIFGIIDNVLTTKYTYRINVDYKMVDEILGWKQAHIFIELYNVKFDITLVLWKTVGDKVEKFFKELTTSSKNIWPANKVEQLIDLISIEFDSRD